jgi:ABC-2 type transport system permease protein
MIHYAKVFWTFLRNSLIRELSMRGNFWIQLITEGIWFASQLFLFNVIFGKVPDINTWTRYEFFTFMATGMIINTLTEALFLPNCANFSEAIRTGNLDFVLLKPIDTQFLVSFEKIDLSAFSQLSFSVGFLCYALWNLGRPIGILDVVAYIGLIGVAVTFFYSLMISLASTSIWLGRNQGLHDFWFYITIFARYPRDIYNGKALWGGSVLMAVFTYCIPILLVVTVPSQVLAQKTMTPSWIWLVAVASSVGGLIVSRGIFQYSLRSYRSASS